MKTVEGPFIDLFEVVRPPRSKSAQSQWFLTSPTSPSPGESSSPEVSPVNSLAPIRDYSEMPRQVSSNKIKNNRKKNRPGRKKPKSAIRSPPDLSLLDFTASTDKNSHLTGPTLAVGNDSLSSCPYMSLSQPGCPKEAGLSTIFQSDRKDVYDARFEVAEGLPRSQIEGNLKHESKVYGSVPLEVSKLGSDGNTFAEEAQKSGYLEIMMNEHSSDVAGSFAITLTADELEDSIAAKELRFRSHMAALLQIRDLDKVEEQPQHSLRSRSLFPAIHQSRHNRQSKPIRRELQAMDKVNMHVGSTQHSRCEKGQRINLRNVPSDVATLDYELQSILRETVQLACPFVSDDNDRKNGNWHTFGSTRALRIFKIYFFQESSPLVLGYKEDTESVKEWCQDVDAWIHNGIPRLNGEQKKMMYEWERKHPSVEKNLMALGFTELEIELLGLDINHSSTSTKPVTSDSVTQQKLTYGDLDEENSFDHFSFLDEKPNVKEPSAANIINHEPTTDPTDLPAKGTGSAMQHNTVPKDDSKNRHTNGEDSHKMAKPAKNGNRMSIATKARPEVSVNVWTLESQTTTTDFEVPEAPVVLPSHTALEIPIKSPSSAASDPPSPTIKTKQDSLMNASALQVFSPAKISYANALQTPVPKVEKPADAWAGHGGEVWGAGKGTSGGDTSAECK